jgi:Ca2+-binding EF-hand superfamily protein
VDGLRQVFDGFDLKKTGLLRQTEATELLKSLGIEVRSVEVGWKNGRGSMEL